MHDASHHSKDRAAWRRSQLHLFEERLAADLFSLEPSRVITRWKQTIRRRIPSSVIHAIQNVAKAMRILEQNPIKATPAGWRLDFAPIMFAHGCDSVGIKDSALEEIQPPKKLHATQGEKVLWQICKSEIQSPK